LFLKNYRKFISVIVRIVKVLHEASSAMLGRGWVATGAFECEEWWDKYLRSYDLVRRRPCSMAWGFTSSPRICGTSLLVRPLIMINLKMTA